MSITYDYVGIGSSPISLIEALERRRRGQRVAIVERAERIGGAWQLVEVFGWKNVEISAHIMRAWPGGYDYFQNRLNVSLETLDPQPSQIVVHENNSLLRYNYNHKWMNELAVLKRRFKRKEIRISDVLGNPGATILMPFKSILHYFLKDLLKLFPKVKYPLGGTRELVDHLKTACENAGVELRVGSIIQSISINRDQQNIEVGIGDETVHAKELGFTQNSDFGELHIDGERVHVPVSTDDTSHVHFLYDPKGLPGFSFVRFLDDRYYHMISDVTQYAQPGPEAKDGHRIIAAWLNGDSVNDGQAAERHFEHLKKMKLVPKRGRLLDWEARTFKRNRIADSAIKELRQSSSGLLQYLETGDLTRDVEFYAPEWTKTFAEARP